MGVPIKIHKLIFQMVENLGKLESEVERRQGNMFYKLVGAKATVMKIFELKGKSLKVGGSKVTLGKLGKKNKCRVVRKGNVIKEGLMISSLKRFAEDVDEVPTGMDCGVSFEGFEDVQKGDVIESYMEIQREPTFSFAAGIQYCD